MRSNSVARAVSSTGQSAGPTRAWSLVAGIRSRASVIRPSRRRRRGGLSPPRDRLVDAGRLHEELSRIVDDADEVLGVPPGGAFDFHFHAQWCRFSRMFPKDGADGPQNIDEKLVVFRAQVGGERPVEKPRP